MEKEIISKIIHAIPSEGLHELNSLLDSNNFDENQIRNLLNKYNINISEVLAEKGAA